MLKSFDGELVKRGQPELVALMAAARELPTMLDAMVRDGRTWKARDAHASA